MLRVGRQRPEAREEALLGSPTVTGLVELVRGTRAPTAKGLAQRVVRLLVSAQAPSCTLRGEQRDATVLLFKRKGEVREVRELVRMECSTADVRKTIESAVASGLAEVSTRLLSSHAERHAPST